MKGDFLNARLQRFLKREFGIVASLKTINNTIHDPKYVPLVIRAERNLGGRIYVERGVSQRLMRIYLMQSYRYHKYEYMLRLL